MRRACFCVAAPIHVPDYWKRELARWRFNSLRLWLANWIGTCTDYWEAAAMYEQLSALSDAELARRELSRSTGRLPDRAARRLPDLSTTIRVEPFSTRPSPESTMIYDVRYDGQGYTADTRTALTPEGLDMHNDSSMGEAPANYISLLCLQPARSGGKSSLSSAYAAHNPFLINHPDLLERLYQLFYRDKQEYQAPDAQNWYPIFAVENGGLRIRFNERVIRRGHQKTGQTMDNAGVQTIAILNSFLTDPTHRHDFWMERGQVQILNNRIIVHGRTPYEDHEEPENRRHLLRLWLRAGDRRQFRG